MSIGENIKKLRREREITQEQLAEFLHITPSAISQWETDRVLPDISYLPMLANIFRVSADVILGIDIDSKDSKIEEIYQEVRKLSCTGHRDEANDLCRKGLESFPDAYILMEELAFNLSYSSERTEQEESISLFERIRVGTNEEGARNFAVGNLCSLYMAVGKKDEAIKLAESIPNLVYTRERCLRMTLRGEEWAHAMKNQCTVDFDTFIWGLRNLLNAFPKNHPIFNEKEMLKLWEKIIYFVEVFYENGDYAFDRQLLAESHFTRAMIFSELGEIENALDSLEKAYYHIEEYEKYSENLIGYSVTIPPEKYPTSLLVRPKDENEAGLVKTVSTPSTENCAMEYLRKMSDSYFDNVRYEKRFHIVEENLRKIARE